MAPAPRPTRRAVLLGVPAAAGLAVLTSCTSQENPPPPPSPVHPDVALRAAAVAREQSLIRAYDAALLAVPALADRLLVLRAEHRTHLTALGAAPASTSPGGPGPGAALAVPTPVPLPAPGAADAQLTVLRTAERTAGTGHTTGLATASAGLAVVLATLAASEASHDVVLG